MRRVIRTAIAIAACAVMCAPAATAQTYPDKPIRWVVGYPPGGAVDIITRTLGPRDG